MRLVWGTVTSVDDHAAGIQALTVALDGGTAGRAVNYTTLAGECVVEDRVLVNTTAVDLTLGTGGRHFVVARQGRAAGVQLDEPSGGHIMKLRYTPLQHDVVAVESPESPHHDVMAQAASLDGMPVVCCGLHSQLPLVAAAIKAADKTLRMAYCMTDSAALAMPLSEVVRSCVSVGLIDSSISCGQAFGGQLEAVNLHSGLLAARHVVGADVAVCAIGPGVVGTATPFGHGGIAQGEAINAAGVLGGRPVAVLRLSFADARPRHRVVSHHTLTALAKIALVPAFVAVPVLSADLADQVDRMLVGAGIWERHHRVDALVDAAGSPDMRGIAVTTMGRTEVDDPAFFSAAYAAGSVAARLARGGLS